jgi:hypothetical protein
MVSKSPRRRKVPQLVPMSVSTLNRWLSNVLHDQTESFRCKIFKKFTLWRWIEWNLHSDDSTGATYRFHTSSYRISISVGMRSATNSYDDGRRPQTT